MAHDKETHPSTLEAILRRRRRRTLRSGLIVLALVLIAGGLYLAMRGEPAPPAVTRQEAPPLTPNPVVRPAPDPPRPAPEPESVVLEAEPPPFTLPELDSSDELVRGLVAELTRHPEALAWLASQDLVRRFVAAVDNIAEGKSPTGHLDLLRPKQKFKVIELEDGAGVDPASYARYDLISDVFVSLDGEGTATLYRKLHPLVERAYAELGYPDQRFDDTLATAIVELLRAPVVVGEVRLSPRVISWEHSDPELEALSAAQKLLLRMGPANAPRVQRKLREIGLALGIAEQALPRPPLHKIMSAAGDR